MAKFFENDKVRITSNPNKQTVYTVVRNVSDELYEVTYKGKVCLVHESEMEHAEKFQKTYSNVCDILSTLRKECEEFLMRVLTINAGQIDTYDDDSDECVSVCYNGGAHPEYASNCYSIVRSVYIKNGKIYLDIEDDDEYPISEITAIELVHVCDHIDRFIL